MSTPIVAFATCAALPDLDPDDALLVPALGRRGVRVVPAVWDDPDVDWAAFDLVVLRSTWDYPERVEAFVAWASSVPRLANPASVVRWNVDKRYLAQIERAGVPVVPTTFVAPGETPPPYEGEVVVKPTVSCGARDTARLRDRAAVHELVGRIHRSGRVAMVQPYLSAVDQAGETAVVFVDGELSHAARKGALLTPDAGSVDRLYAVEQMSTRLATDAEVTVARAALAAVPASEPLLYARIDLVPGPDGSPVVLEIEITEPSLFLALGSATDRLATAVARRCGISG